MRKRPRRLRPAKADINVTPFIDILLVLLVIFMTITPRMPVGYAANIPQTPPPGPTQPQDDRAIIISMDRNGEIRINRTVVELSAVPAKLLEIFKSRNDKTAFIEADSELLFSQIAQLIDVARAGGIDRVGLITEAISR
jgi:biopolymer transport protein ExbD/biopolymer transport protein TolR